MTGRHTGRARAHGPSWKRWGSTGLLLVLAAGIAAAVLTALAGRDGMSWARCRAHPVVVRVAVSGEIEPAIQRLGRVFNSEHPPGPRRCAPVSSPAATP